MVEDEFLKRRTETTWTNFHGTVTVPIRALWEINNPSSASSLQHFRATADRLQRLIAHAVDRGERLRAVGSRWSFSEVAAAKDGWALRTSSLNYQFNVGAAFLETGTPNKPGELVLAQCG
jgi:FAD/FMN-containing dehydrogenase